MPIPAHRKQVDCVVVGAGFSGLACALAAASRGLETVVFERKPDPGAHVHTTGILVKEAADQWDIPSHLTHRVPVVKMISPGGRELALVRKGYYFLTTDMPNLMRWFAEQATRAGATIHCGSPAGRIIEHADGVELPDHGLFARHLVAADGGMSPTARMLKLDVNTKFLVGKEWELSGIPLDPETMLCFPNSDLARGYLAWAVPGVDRIQVGLACRQPMRPNLKVFYEQLKSQLDLSSAKVVGVRGGRIPVNGPLKNFHTRHVTLVGDAAGMVSPMTAGGIHTSLHFGRRVGILVADYLLANGHRPGPSLAKEIPGYRIKGLLRRLIDLPIPNSWIDLAFGSSAFRALSQLVYFHNRGLWSADAWREIARLNREND